MGCPLPTYPAGILTAAYLVPRYLRARPSYRRSLTPGRALTATYSVSRYVRAPGAVELLVVSDPVEPLTAAYSRSRYPAGRGASVTSNAENRVIFGPGASRKSPRDRPRAVDPLIVSISQTQFAVRGARNCRARPFTTRIPRPQCAWARVSRSGTSFWSRSTSLALPCIFSLPSHGDQRWFFPCRPPPST